ncbi:hypothetical protein JMJ77_0003998 [Colletotrichum scovillei]|uniref:Uncharacterized protein n=1 Tax=Colletotrichum scovillei TaxID=1209932 RepID=A0A9P7QYW8_9PEZI|nr:hypothetical protein JMJ77_0003998 [Colletotrichum scovillei]KAG7049246.1 hypothetical protein JMJ78_0013229 [Colletotrichum scovillei]KAG7063987.1 hypothetical protein JMJ76_0007035 [Colletotrichum scovillei]
MRAFSSDDRFTPRASGLVETLGRGSIHSDALAGSCQLDSLFFVLVDSSAQRRRFRPARPGLGRSLTPVVWPLQEWVCGFGMGLGFMAILLY